MGQGICRRLLKEKEAYLILLEALHVADFEELPLKHDICEVLSKLGSSDPDTSSTVRSSFPYLAFANQAQNRLNCVSIPLIGLPGCGPQA